MRLYYPGMVLARKVLVAYLLACFQLSSAMSEEPKVTSITYQKPNPCYTLDRYSLHGDTLRVFLKREPGETLCIQLITEDRLKLPHDEAEALRFVEVFIGKKLWRRFELKPR
ncbi:hypothetical protein [Hydrogenivirga sp.]